MSFLATGNENQQRLQAILSDPTIQNDPESAIEVLADTDELQTRLERGTDYRVHYENGAGQKLAPESVEDDEPSSDNEDEDFDGEDGDMTDDMIDSPVPIRAKTPTGSVAKRRGMHEEMLGKASEEVIVVATRQAYDRLFKHWLDYLERERLIESQEAFLEVCKQIVLPSYIPEYLCYWLMDQCDVRNPGTGEENDATRTYSHAEKMRAAVSHYFARVLKRGTTPWTEVVGHPGMFSGNPSLSFTVGQYMLSLRRRKARLGDLEPTSAKAVDESTLKRLWEENWFTGDFSEPSDGEDGGGGKRKRTEKTEFTASADLRVMVMAAISLSFLCLLRMDETLRMEWHWIAFEKTECGGYRMRVKIPYRKTHQTGGIAPFVLYPNTEKPWLDAVSWMARWAQVNKANNQPLEGYVFRRRTRSGNLNVDCTKSMTAATLLDQFRHMLVEVGVSGWRAYGNHSFRRGGCQYLATSRRWPLRKICAWGGWSDTETGTIFKYLLSKVDDVLAREDYFNPVARVVDWCPHCGRDCPCAASRK